MFGRATIRLGIGPHSSYSFFVGQLAELGLVGLGFSIRVSVTV